MEIRGCPPPDDSVIQSGEKRDKKRLEILGIRFAHLSASLLPAFHLLIRYRRCSLLCWYDHIPLIMADMFGPSLLID